MNILTEIIYVKKNVLKSKNLLIYSKDKNNQNDFFWKQNICHDHNTIICNT